MNNEPNYHHLQIELIQALLFSSKSSFSALQKITGLEGNQVTFHLKRLAETGLIEKTDKGYKLTIAGKEFANRLDTDEGTIEKQPKTSVLLIVPREKDGRTEFLTQQRLKHPWFEYFVYVTGKMRWGESVFMAAARELHEETGLSGSFKLLAIDHERDFVKDTGEVLEDKIFYVVLCEDLEGEVAYEFEGGRNQWMTKDEYLAEKNIDGAARMFEYLGNESVTFSENEYFFDKEDF